jgi:hypothetical protein
VVRVSRSMGASALTSQTPSLRRPWTLSLKQRIVGAEGTSLAANARRRRCDMFLTHFAELQDMAVVDLGGTPEFWRGAPIRPRHVTCVNPDASDRRRDHNRDEPWLTMVRGDACSISDIGTFDLAFSNSTIEHVGGHAPRLAFAKTLRALSPRYWVQTPYRYFPIEPHFIFSLMQFLPPDSRRSSLSTGHCPTAASTRVAMRSTLCSGSSYYRSPICATTSQMAI